MLAKYSRLIRLIIMISLYGSLIKKEKNILVLKITWNSMNRFKLFLLFSKWSTVIIWSPVLSFPSSTISFASHSFSPLCSSPSLLPSAWPLLFFVSLLTLFPSSLFLLFLSHLPCSCRVVPLPRLTPLLILLAGEKGVSSFELTPVSRKKNNSVFFGRIRPVEQQESVS